MDKFKEIRPIVLGIAKNNNKILVSKGYDKIKNQHFYRCIGGGIEFLEKSDVTIKREFKEEINAEVEVKEFLGISENIFTFNGKNGHELILFYNVEINKDDIKEEYHIVDDKVDTYAVWVDIDKFISKEEIIYPEQVVDYLK